MAEGPEEGKRRLADRDRSADQGEREAEYKGAGWGMDGDPADRRRAEAVEENLRGRGDHPSGMTAQDEAWQREKQNLGQTADQPGLPRTWSEGDQPERKHNRPVGERMGRRLRADELPDSAEETQG